jgi:hypothetical protein
LFNNSFSSSCDITIPDNKTAMLRLTFPASHRLLRDLRDFRDRGSFPSCIFMWFTSFCYNENEILLKIQCNCTMLPVIIIWDHYIIV